MLSCHDVVLSPCGFMKWLGSWGRAALCWVPVVADIEELVVVEVRVARCCCVVRSVTSQMTEVLFELTKFFGM